MILLLVFLLSGGLFFKSESAERNKRSLNSDFDLHAHRQRFITLHDVDGAPQGVCYRSLKLSARPDHRYRTLHEAAAADDVRGIDLLLRQDTNQNHLESFDENGQTPLQVAVDCGSGGAIEALLKRGANVHTYDANQEYTALSLAQAYFTATVDANHGPLLVMKQVLGDSLQVSFKKNKKSKKATTTSVQKPTTTKIRLRRRIERSVTPEPPADKSPEYDPYVLNV